VNPITNIRNKPISMMWAFNAERMSMPFVLETRADGRMTGGYAIGGYRLKLRYRAKTKEVSDRKHRIVKRVALGNFRIF